MNDEDKETHTPAEFYSAFSNAVYKEDNEDKLKELERQEITGWEIDPDVNNIDRTAFRRRNKNDDGYDVILASRGTSQTRNLLPDLAIMFGGEGYTKRYKELSQDYEKTKFKYAGANDNIVSTGHSLAGNQSVFLNRKYGVESHAFNAGASISHMKQGFVNNLACWANPEWGHCKRAEKSHIYHTPLDPLSTASLFDRDNKEIHSRKKGQHPHTINNFLKNI
jgi:hypothetical protein